jgi:hypothetical protein
MIQELVTFFGEQGQRMAQIGFLATCVVTPFWVVDFIQEEKTILTKFFYTEEEAEEAAIKFAFEGILCDQNS